MNEVSASGERAATARRGVVHVVPALFGWDNVFGGGERYALELARAMARRLPTRLIAFGSRSRRLALDGLEVRVLRNWANFRRFRFDPVTPTLWRHLAGAGIIHVHQPETMMASQALAVARATGKPIYSTHLGGAGLGLHRLIDVTSWYAGHLHISEFSRRAFGHEGLPTARVIGGGVDVEAYRPDPSLPRDGGVVYVGRVLPHKGINYLIEAMDPDIPLTIVGRRWRHAQAFGALLDRLSEGKDIRFIEGREHQPGTWAVDDHGEIIDACRRALCVVLPSVHETVFGEHYAIPELLGLVLLEGMACGAPAIVSDVCSLPEVVRDGETGFVVPPNDPEALRSRIRYLRDHPEAARRMGEAARRDVLERFTWDRVVDRCLEAYGLADLVSAGAEAGRGAASGPSSA